MTSAVADYPKGFVPDLRRLRPWPSLRGSLWRTPALARLTYGALARLVAGSIGPRPCKVLYVGPGLGHITLELARAHHAVTGVDVDQESVALAIRAARLDRFDHERGSLSYEVARFPDEFAGEGPYDRVLFSRVLHHVEDPVAAVERAADLLAPTGRVVCVEFAHDQLGSSGARWMARARLRLSRSGWWPEPVGRSLEEETGRVTREWRTEHEDEGLHPFQAMLDPLRAKFHLQRLRWHPYLFWDLAAEMRVPRDEEETVARALRDREADQLRRARLHGVLFSTSGRKR